MIYLYINNKIKYNVSKLSNKELLAVINQLSMHDIQLKRIVV